jgi:SAM-dependent methyltransferase
MHSKADAGAAIYGPLTLRAYDFWVLGVSNRFAWGCPTSVLLARFESQVGARHLDIGVGSGYFLAHCRFPAGSPHIVLADLNPASLNAAARRIRHLQPATHRVDVLQPFTLPESPFDSVSMNYLLHCLPGPLAAKAPAVRHAAAQLRPGGILFGATILGEGVQHNAFGAALMGVYNRRGIFSNRDDSLAALQTLLGQELEKVEVRQLGRVALFSGRRAA